MSPLATIIGATLIWLAAVVSPGPNFLVVSRLALSRSRGSAIGAALGIAVGSLIYAALTMFGLSVLILRFAWLGDTIRIVGGAYLVWLGIQARRARPEDLHPAAAGAAQRVPSVLVGQAAGRLPDGDHQPEDDRVLPWPVRRGGASGDPSLGQARLLSAGGIIEVAWYTAVSFALSSGPMRAG
jgi:threonine efflux protein